MRDGRHQPSTPLLRTQTQTKTQIPLPIASTLAQTLPQTQGTDMIILEPLACSEYQAAGPLVPLALPHQPPPRTSRSGQQAGWGQKEGGWPMSLPVFGAWFLPCPISPAVFWREECALCPEQTLTQASWVGRQLRKRSGSLHPHQTRAPGSSVGCVCVGVGVGVPRATLSSALGDFQIRWSTERKSENQGPLPRHPQRNPAAHGQV